jgi:hypothetical protein
MGLLLGLGRWDWGLSLRGCRQGKHVGRVVCVGGVMLTIGICERLERGKSQD